MIPLKMMSAHALILVLFFACLNASGQRLGEGPNLEVLTVPNNYPCCRGVSVFDESMELPLDHDLVVSYVMTLKYITSAEAVRVFTEKLGDMGSYCSMAPVPNASAVVITTSVSKIRGLIGLEKEIDIQK